MRLSGRPLLDNEADQALFVGRGAELLALQRSLRAGLNCLVAGDPGSGKTSLVRALIFGSQTDQVRFSYARVGDARSASDLLASVLAAVTKGNSDGGPPGGRREQVDRQPIELIAALASALSEHGDPEPGTRVIVVEDVPAAAGFDTFGAWRDELWHLDALWLVTTSTAQVSGLARAPADVFFETMLELGPLLGTDAAELLRRRLDGLPAEQQSELIVTALSAAPETPRRLLDLARELVATPAVGGGRLNTVSGLKARTEALEQVSRPARMLAGEVDALGWVSASDQRLLDRMGWTRPRVVQVIAELESRGLVEMREENTGRGRPRKLYRLTPAANFVSTDVVADGPDPTADGPAPPETAEPS